MFVRFSRAADALDVRESFQQKPQMPKPSNGKTLKLFFHSFFVEVLSLFAWRCCGDKNKLRFLFHAWNLKLKEDFKKLVKHRTDEREIKM